MHARVGTCPGTQASPYPNLDFWILQIDVPLSQQVAVGSWLNEQAPHLDEVRLGQVVTILFVEDSKGNALLCRRGEGRALMTSESWPPPLLWHLHKAQRGQGMNSRSRSW